MINSTKITGNSDEAVKSVNAQQLSRKRKMQNFTKNMSPVCIFSLERRDAIIQSFLTNSTSDPITSQ